MTRRRPILTSALVAGTAASALLLTGCGLQPATAFVPATAPGTIKPIAGLPDDAHLTVTTKNFTEQLILGKIAVLAAQTAGFDVTDMTNTPGSVAVRQLMLTGGADMTYEYTGTAWLTYLGNTKGIPDKQKQYAAVRDADAANGLDWLTPAPLNNTYAMAVRSEAVKDLDGISSLSQIKDLPVSERTFCVESEFNSRADGFRPMLAKYGLKLGSSGEDGVPSSNVSILDTGTVYTATDRGKCNFGEVFTTDGRINSLDLTVLDDDEGFFPAYNVAPVFASATLKEYPQLKGVFDQISPKLTDTQMRKLNLKVDVDGEEPADVAFDWMVKEGFISRP
ncbi:osmoprotectant transport system substrate-binding protein [Frondihabitans sp. PhB188]|uniref:glycine betaine ABC transporter substrate-binding protein n=1 Tax=Frondihabitans sp. PhB188 TaxID=2485200 RepID=UPI000F47061D|nr:glycine betaine ABC transporter substrate-binding protein [Frondihabitans sp. PhB188]ROQ38672.1 osmoprotectant transport system substrate-binding protein [Frondihabitans sp. PhB188]